MKRLFSLLLLFISLNSFAQILILGKNNQLDRMIRNSIESYIENVDEFCTKRGFTPPGVYYVCKEGLTTSFTRNDSIRSIPRVKYVSLDNYDSRSLKKMLKKGFGAMFVETKLHKNQIIIAVSDCSVSNYKGFPAVGIKDWGIYTYEYSEDKEDWVLVKSEIGGI